MIEAMIIIAALVIWIFAKHSVSLCDCDDCLNHSFITKESLKL